MPFDFGKVMQELSTLCASDPPQTKDAKYLEHGGFGASSPKTLVFGSNGVQRSAIFYPKDRLFGTLQQISGISWSAHRDVLDDQIFRALYGYISKYSFEGFDYQGLRTFVPSDAMPCHVCGMILPLTSIEIDHRHAQKGDALMCALKTLRAIGMTQSGPSGLKGNVLLHRAQPTFIFPKTNDPPPARSFQAAVGKSSLDHYGETFIWTIGSLTEESQKQFINCCKNSMANLRPLCRKCNGSKSNSWRALCG